ncbi:NAD(P)H-hydrate epimerase [Chloroflexota bacterium]
MEIPSLTTEQMREVDRRMIKVYGIDLLQMMENAGRNLAELAIRMLAGTKENMSVTVLCGSGNNGGGGMVAARHLHNRGINTRVVLAADISLLKEAPSHQWLILKNMGLDIEGDTIGSADLVLDALLGYGVVGDPRPMMAKYIQLANNQSAPILSLDTPSGLDTTSGLAHNPTIRARATMTLALPKTGLLEPPAREFVGDLYLADIGVPTGLYQKAFGMIIPILFSGDTIIPIKME